MGEEYEQQKIEHRRLSIQKYEYEAYIKQRGKDMQVLDSIREKNKEAGLGEIEQDVQEAIAAVRAENA